MNVVFLGLSITSSWGNGHATNYRALAEELDRQAHHVVFCERDVPWYAQHRDAPDPPGAEVILYRSLKDLAALTGAAIHDADLVVIGSYVPEGPEVIRWVLSTARGVTAFYDIDTPVTLAKLDAGDYEYLEPELIEPFDLYLSFTGGPTLERLRELGARHPLAFYCLVDERRYRPQEVAVRWDLGYLGTYSDDRQPTLERLLLEPAAAFPELRSVVAGPQYPETVRWPGNVERIEHLPPAAHPGFYCAQRYTLNVTRAAMRAVGYAPSVRLFEAAACGTPVISDRWPGLETIFVPGEEILLADAPADVLRILRETDEEERARIAAAARRRVLGEHTAEHRVAQLLEAVRALGAEVAA